MDGMSKKTSNDVLKAIEERRRRRKEQEKNVDWYSWLISEHPYLVLFLCMFIISGCIIVSVLYVKPPDFSEPSKGFEVRGTALSDRVITWKNLYDNTGFNATLSTYPPKYTKYLAEARKSTTKKKSGKRNRKSNAKKKNKVRNRRSVMAYNWNFTTDRYFCNNPISSYARMVLEPTDALSIPLWSTEGMYAICRKEKALLSNHLYSDVCTHQIASTCCPTLSIANYVAFLSGVATCEEINDLSMRRVGRLLKDCSLHYLDGSLVSDCWGAKKEVNSDKSDSCKDIPSKCTKFNAVYSIFHYLTDTNFLHNIIESKDNKFDLQYTAVFMPALRGKDLADLYYENFQNPNSVDNSIVLVTGIDFGLKDTVFDDTLRVDSVYPIVAMSAVMVIIVLYTGSIFITLMSSISCISALFMAYFLYAVIFEFAYFPFMNLTAIMVMVGIGADNVLVYCSAWQSYKKEDNAMAGGFIKKHNVRAQAPSNRLGVLTRVTLKHAARSMFVTGITTASAFLSNFASSVTAIKCFGMYTGLTVLMNLFLCLTWLPASVIIHEKHFSGLWHRLLSHSKKTKALCLPSIKRFKDMSRVFFHKIQVYIIVRWRWFWITFGTTTAIAGCLVIFVIPKLRLPTTDSYFQYFKSSHPFETYTLTKSEKFAFEKKGLGYMPVRVVFGVTPTDNGDRMDPDDSGSLVFNSHFNMSDPESQTWLLQFCKRVRQEDFYKVAQSDFENMRMCFIEAFMEWMSLIQCKVNGESNYPCCSESIFPYHPAVFTKCLKKAVVQLSYTPGVQLNRLTPGPRFDANDSLRAVILEFPSIQPYTGSYEEVAKFYNTVETWMSRELEKAPPGLRGDAWFISNLEFHALQLGLYQGTVTSIGLSMLVVCATLLLTTCNLMITLLAELTIACTIFVVVGILVVLGWELNILESVTVSIAIGLSVDFTVHYAVAYLLVPAKDRLSRVEISVSSMGPAIALAALTTFLAGACMLPAQVTAYYKFGIFLMLIMSVSWFYATYFFQALCSIIGPEGRCGHMLTCCCGLCKCKSKHCKGRFKKTKLRNESSSSLRKCSRICTEKKGTSSESHSVTVIEMSSCASV